MNINNVLNDLPAAMEIIGLFLKAGFTLVIIKKDMFWVSQESEIFCKPSIAY